MKDETLSMQSSRGEAACPVSPQYSRRSTEFLDDDDWSNWEDPQYDVVDDENDENHAKDDILQNLPAQLHPAVSLGMRRVSSCYFSIHSTPSNSVNDLLSLWDETEGAPTGESRESPQKENRSSPTSSSKEWNACDILYHDIMMHVFTFLDAQALAAFSETAHRPNFECFYFLQLQLQRALLVIPSTDNAKGTRQRNNDDNLAAIAGSGCISRLAAVDMSAAQEIVQTYTNSNSTLRTMPLSHSLAYIRHVLRKHGFPHHSPKASQSVASAAIFITLVGFSASIMQGVDYSAAVDLLPNALFKMGLAGSMLKVGVTAGNAARKAATEQHHEMRETAEQMARMMQELPSQLLQQLQHGAPWSNHDEHHGNSSDQEEEESNTNRNFPSAIAARMYAAFSAAYGPTNTTRADSLSEETPLESPRSVRDQRTRNTRRPRVFSESSVTRDNRMDRTDQQCDYDEHHEDEVLQALAMQHPLTPNPYEHLPLDLTRAIHEEEEENEANVVIKQRLSKSSLQKMPSGCVGAYSRAVRLASQQLTNIIKERRKANFAFLTEEEQNQLSTTFIDACSSDDNIDLIKELLLVEDGIDVDGFYVGSDGTETCALHTAAFHGAARVVEFVVGGLDENNADKDGGLCVVDQTDLNGWTAMHFAAGANCVEVVRVLASHGANLTVEALNGYTPYHWAQRLANHEVAEELQRLGADKRFIDATNPLSMIANRFFAMIPTH